jgi:putative addiction module component (TIGR02574 family)
MAVAIPNLPLKEMSINDKVETMETLWESLSADPAAVESPDWHQDELRVREARVESGDAKFVDWEKSKTNIRRQTS